MLKQASEKRKNKGVESCSVVFEVADFVAQPAMESEDSGCLF
jgi:hypothetical protein